MTAFTRCWHILKMVKNVMDRLPVHTKTALFLPADFKKMTDFENGRSWKMKLWLTHFEYMAFCDHLKLMKTEHFLMLSKQDRTILVV